jgi:hypothetical protein
MAFTTILKSTVPESLHSGDFYLPCMGSKVVTRISSKVEAKANILSVYPRTV